jgi:hypothetical protein
MSSSIKKSISKPKSTASKVVAAGRKNRQAKNKRRVKVERYFELEASESGDEGSDGGEEEEEPENSSDRDFIVPDGEEEEGEEEYTGPRMDWGDWDQPLCVSRCRAKKGLKRLRRGDGSIPREETKTKEEDSLMRHLEDDLA